MRKTGTVATGLRLTMPEGFGGDAKRSPIPRKPLMAIKTVSTLLEDKSD